MCCVVVWWCGGVSPRASHGSSSIADFSGNLRAEQIIRLLRVQAPYLTGKERAEVEAILCMQEQAKKQQRL
jgi:hypothetical protein